MMKTILSKSSKFGIVAGIILIFCEMINLTSTLAEILEKLFTGGTAAKNAITPFYMGLVVGLIVFFTTINFLRTRNSQKKYSFGQGFFAAVTISIVSGLLISLLNIILGSYLVNGTDVRVYLEALAPDVIRAFLFQTDIQKAVTYYFMSTILGSMAALILFWISQKTNQPAKSVRALTHLKEKIQIGRAFERYPAVKTVLILLLIIAFLLLPLVINAYTISVLGIVLIYAIMGLGLNLIVGLSGQLVFGYVAFFALGAYTFGLLTAPKPFGIEMNFWLALLVSLIVAGIGGFLVGLPIMNLRGDYLAIVTLGFAEIVRILINSNLMADYTGGPQGIKNIG